MGLGSGSLRTSSTDHHDHHRMIHDALVNRLKETEMETIAPAYGWDVACIPCHRYAIGQGKQGWCFAVQVNTDDHGEASWVPLACLQMTLPTKGSKDLMVMPHFVTGMK